ncbi:MAG: tRNA (N(6)-L-threonylcarbamoyladenosine(37)-C(2))-methylthiotransferase MtaB [Rhodospirillales bacterium]|nr:tRNA (N(6)-L-threonylcarbamoyladenosine(37)-C(2))-methylthiotransferase MtaB [Rhodospirillales bacterium]
MAEPLVVTLGCRLNAFESEVIRHEAAAAGTDAVIVNTCAVTGEAVRQARQTIRKLRRRHPERRIIVTGCAAQLAPESFAAMPEVDRVLGNIEKLDRATLADGGQPLAVADIMTVRDTAAHLLDGFEGRARAFVEVQQGCDHRCTFCIIPFARGPARSISRPLVVERVRRLVAAGFREIVLTGVDICSWGSDLSGSPTFGSLARAVLAEVPELARLRLSSLDPAAVDNDLFSVLADEPRLMPHLHLSLQAMDDLVLKRMKRRHDRARAFDVATRARAVRPDVVLGADLIAGFPTESEAMFEVTLDSVEALGLTWLHVFPFSARAGTPAARMPQVPGPLRRERAARLRVAGDAARSRFLAGRVGETTDVLVETPGVARCPRYAPVAVSDDAEPGSLLRVRIRAADTERLYAETTP